MFLLIYKNIGQIFKKGIILLNSFKRKVLNPNKNWVLQNMIKIFTYMPAIIFTIINEQGIVLEFSGFSKAYPQI